MNFPNWFDAFMTLLFLFIFVFGFLTLILYIHFIYMKISNTKEKCKNECSKDKPNSDKE